MKTIKSCEFNTTGCAELRFRDGSMIFIDCIAAENEVADNRLRRSEPVCLIRNSETENAAARRAFRQTRRASTACACPPAWILRFRLRLDENGAHIRHAFAERERDGLAVMGEAEDAVCGEL